MYIPGKASNHSCSMETQKSLCTNCTYPAKLLIINVLRKPFLKHCPMYIPGKASNHACSIETQKSLCTNCERQVQLQYFLVANLVNYSECLSARPPDRLPVTFLRKRDFIGLQFETNFSNI